MLKFTFRSLWRDRTYTALNLIGLATGLAAALLVLLWVQDELTFDRTHRQGKNIVRILTNWDFGGNRQWTSVTPAGLVPAAKAEIPEVQEAVRTWRFGTRAFQIGPTVLEAENTLIVDNSFFEVFDFPLLRSDGSKPLSTSNGILITEKLARKFFADADPLGKTVRFDNKLDLVVTGILQDPPSNSSIQFSCLMPWEPLANQIVRDPKNAFHWGQMSYTSWLLMRPEADRSAVAHKLAAIAARHRDDKYDPFWYALQPLHQVYLDSDMLQHDAGTGDRKTIAVFGLIGLLVLLIACINYVNLATARASTRAKEVGVRKSIGAGRGELFSQFLAESGVLIAAATGLAVLLALAALPMFNELSGKDFRSEHFLQPNVWRVILGAAAFALLLAGIYPALLLTRFNPAAVLRGQFFALGGGSGSSGAVLRKTLVTSQFVFSLVLITGAFIIARQMSFVRAVKLGYDPQQVFSMAMYGSESPMSVMKNELAGKPGIATMTSTNNPFIDLGSQNGGMDWEGKPEGKQMPIWQLGVDGEVSEFFGLQLTEGRWFRPEMNGWDTTSFLINEAAAREMGFAAGEAAGKWVDFNGTKGTVAGVLKDFHFKSLHSAIEPLIFYQNPEWLDIIYIKTAPGKSAEAIASAQAVFEKFVPGRLFKYRFVDEEYDRMYKAEARAGTLFNLFAGLAVLISCLGLLGLVTFAAQHRAKEIGIRKVLGASVASVVGLLAQDFLRLVLLAIVIASPIAYYLVQKWLSDFAYRIDLQWWMFAVAGLAAVVVAFLTVSSQAVRAALANPAKSLRSE